MDASQPEATKRCPFCGEQILAVAIKCKHCGSALDGQAPQQSTGGIASGALAAAILAPAANWRGIAAVVIGTIPFSVLDLTYADKLLSSVAWENRYSLLKAVLTAVVISTIAGSVAGLLARVLMPHLQRAGKVAAGLLVLAGVYAFVLDGLHLGVIEELVESDTARRLPSVRVISLLLSVAAAGLGIAHTTATGMDGRALLRRRWAVVGAAWAPVLALSVMLLDWSAGSFTRSEVILKRVLILGVPLSLIVGLVPALVFRLLLPSEPGASKNASMKATIISIAGAAAFVAATALLDALLRVGIYGAFNFDIEQWLAFSAGVTGVYLVAYRIALSIAREPQPLGSDLVAGR